MGGVRDERPGAARQHWRTWGCGAPPRPSVGSLFARPSGERLDGGVLVGGHEAVERLLDLLELEPRRCQRLRPRRLVLVRMPLLGQQAVRLLDFVLRGAHPHPEHLVVGAVAEVVNLALPLLLLLLPLRVLRALLLLRHLRLLEHLLDHPLGHLHLLLPAEDLDDRLRRPLLRRRRRRRHRRPRPEGLMLAVDLVVFLLDLQARLGLFLNPPDGLATLANHQLDLVRRDRDSSIGVGISIRVVVIISQPFHLLCWLPLRDLFCSLQPCLHLCL
mmetsp:Transcript_16654/g.36215  ORF Transcript_16654/g.36215 Transcript_16654/m.36215 type:complete len:273 (-) Transcript_16654:714-1532(-)